MWITVPRFVPLLESEVWPSGELARVSKFSGDFVAAKFAALSQPAVPVTPVPVALRARGTVRRPGVTGYL
jgi:hypothetical protein